MYRPPLTYKADYLYEAWYENIDYAFAYEWFRRHTPVSVGACSTVRKGNLIGRNLDWTYDESAEFIVHTDSVVGVANAIPGLTDAFVKSGADDEAYKIVPFMLSDGMNKHGLFVSTLVVPTDKGDNSVVHPMELELEELCTLMLPRFVLDRFDNADSACGFLMRFVRLYHPKTLQDKHYDQHFVIADKHDTFCMEFVDGQYVVHDISDKPFVTNFHLSGVTFNADESVNTPASGKASDNGVTDNGSGLERYNLINERMQDVLFHELTRNAMPRLMQDLAYTRAYQSNPYAAYPRWDTEFVGNGRTVDTPTADYDLIQLAAAGEYQRRTRVTGKTWQTVHSVVYDVQDRKLHLYAQENYDTQWEVSVMAEQTHIQRLRGDTAKNDNYTGLNGEMTINSTTQVTRLHDGIKKGGYGQAFAAHYDTLPATVPNDLHEGAIVIEGDGAIEGGVSIINAMPYNTREILTTSGTYTAPVTGWYKVICIGGGGGGGATYDSNYAADGGGSGGFSYGYKYLTKGSLYPYVIGAGGAGGLNRTNAGNGGNTTFADIVAGGGYGAAAYGETSIAPYSMGGTGDFCGFAGTTGNRTWSPQSSTYVGIGGSGGGFGGGVSLKVIYKDAVSYGGGGAGTNTAYNGGGANVSGGNGYQGCVILEYYDPDKLPEAA